MKFVSSSHEFFCRVMSVRCSHLLIKHEGSRNPVSRRTNEVGSARVVLADGSRL